MNYRKLCVVALLPLLFSHWAEADVAQAAQDVKQTTVHVVHKTGAVARGAAHGTVHVVKAVGHGVARATRHGYHATKAAVHKATE